MLRTSRLLRALVAVAAIAAVLAVFFQVVYRPWQRNWGSTEQEINRRMPGDEIITAPTFIATRAVTIRDRPEAIWPWIVQIGYKRAGFYSWDRLDNDGIPSAVRILPEFQNLAVGDEIPLSADADAQVRELTPNRSLLLLYGHDSDSDEAMTWAWGLYPLDGEHTRLVTRLRWRPHGPLAPLFFDAVEIVMMRKCLLGIKRRVEVSPPSPPSVSQPPTRRGVGFETRTASSAADRRSRVDPATKKGDRHLTTRRQLPTANGNSES